MKVPKVSTSAPNVDRLPGTDRDIISCCFLVCLFCPCKCRFHCCCSCHIGLKPMLFASEPKFRVVASSECQSGFLRLPVYPLCSHVLSCAVLFCAVPRRAVGLAPARACASRFHATPLLQIN